MANIIEGVLTAKGLRFAIVVSRFNDFISSSLREGALDTLVRSGAVDEDIDVTVVPGSFEIPTVARLLSKTNRYDAVICLGAIIRGATPHFEYVASVVAKGIAKVSLSEQMPIVFGVITADNLEQAIERAGTKSGNRGRDAALTAIEMANLFRLIKSPPFAKGD